MRKRQTPGERIAEGEYLMTTFEGGDLQKDLAKRIDRAIRRAQAQAWHEGLDAGRLGIAQDDNPYRKAKR